MCRWIGGVTAKGQIILYSLPWSITLICWVLYQIYRLKKRLSHEKHVKLRRSSVSPFPNFLYWVLSKDGKYVNNIWDVIDLRWLQSIPELSLRADWFKGTLSQVDTARAFDPKLEKVSLMFSSWTLALSIWRRLVDFGHGGKRSNSGRKRKYDGREEYKKARSKSHKRIYLEKRIFQVCEGEHFCASQPMTVSL